MTNTAFDRTADYLRQMAESQADPIARERFFTVLFALQQATDLSRSVEERLERIGQLNKQSQANIGRIRSLCEQSAEWLRDRAADFSSDIDHFSEAQLRAWLKCTCEMMNELAQDFQTIADAHTKEPEARQAR